MKDLFESFDVFAVAPSGVKKLRELILQLAVQGKLVPQDPNDEPASVLLKKIAAEKTRLVAEGKIKKSEPLSPIDPDEVPFGVPSGWELCRVGQVFTFEYGKSLPSKARSENGKYAVYGSNGVVGQHEEYLVKEPSLVVGRKGSCGAVNLAIDPFWPIDTTYYVTPPTGISLRYSFYLLRTLGLAELDKSTAIPGLNRQDAYNKPIGLPPSNEQHRIVARVDQLMSLCDELETKYNAQQDQRQKLNAAALDRLLSAEDEAEFAAAWQRVCDSFDLLYDAPESVTKLRQAILQLAVMGKLVKQEPGDEPAAVLLKKIAAEKARLVAEGKIRKSESLPPIEPDEVPFEVPEGWEWVRMADVVLSTEAGWSPQCEKERRTGSNWGVLKVSAVSWDRFLPEENKELPAQLDPRPEWEVHSGDFLMSRANTDLLVGKSVVVGDTPPRLLMSDKIIRVHFSGLVNSSFFNAVNNGPTSRAYYARTASGTSSSMKNISRGTVLNLPVPVPPQAQHHLIMARIDQLMSLCDELESKLTAARERAERLVGLLQPGRDRAGVPGVSEVSV